MKDSAVALSVHRKCGIDGIAPQVYIFDKHIGLGSNWNDALSCMKKMYSMYVAEEENDGIIAIDNDNCYVNEDKGYSKIAWEDGDIQEFFITPVESPPSSCIPDPYSDEDEGETEKLISISTAHITPDAFSYLSKKLEADTIQVYPNSTGCLLHFSSLADIAEIAIPACIMDCINYAENRKANWVRLDSEAPKRKGLLTYSKQWGNI